MHCLDGLPHKACGTVYAARAALALSTHSLGFAPFRYATKDVIVPGWRCR
jgi:hypothetical protein